MPVMEYCLGGDFRPRDYPSKPAELSKHVASHGSRAWVPRLLGMLGCPRSIQPEALHKPTSLACSQEEEEEREEHQGGVAFGGLPDHLLENIFTNLVSCSRRTHFSVCGVSRTWRSLGRQMFFTSPWSGAHLICHPVQLFCLSPRPVTTTRTGMLKCYVQREPRSVGQQRRFSFYMGRDHRQPRRVRFLMCALQVSRWELLIFLDKECREAPVGRLSSNAFCTRYSLALAPGVQLLVQPEGPPWAEGGGFGRGGQVLPGRYPLSSSNNGASPGSHWGLLGQGTASVGSNSTAAGATGTTRADDDTAASLSSPPPTLMGWLQYKARLRALMQPRKVEVELPASSKLSFGQGLPTLSRASVAAAEPAGPAASAGDGPAAAAAAAAAAGTAEHHTQLGLGQGEGQEGSVHSLRDEGFPSAGPPGGVAAPGIAPGDAPTAQEQHRDAVTSGQGGRQHANAAAAGGTPLRNKPPQWNADLKCWCLNFRGRVKQASVKNFQLVRGGDPSERVVLQFGKVERDVYILDFNPTVVTAFQAFCIALSTFDGKLML